MRGLVNTVLVGGLEFRTACRARDQGERGAVVVSVDPDMQIAVSASAISGRKRGTTRPTLYPPRPDTPTLVAQSSTPIVRIEPCTAAATRALVTFPCPVTPPVRSGIDVRHFLLAPVAIPVTLVTRAERLVAERALPFGQELSGPLTMGTGL